MATDDIYEEFELERAEAFEWFQGELAGIRGGRVKPEMVERVMVEHYGTRAPLKGLASISNSDARTLVVSPWDKGALQAIERALTEADVGAQPSVDGDVIRLSFSSLTEEVREKTAKQLHGKGEETRVRLRQARDEGIKKFRDMKEKGEITEDDFYDAKKKLDELIGTSNQEIDKLIERKEEEVRQI